MPKYESLDTDKPATRRLLVVTTSSPALYVISHALSGHADLLSRSSSLSLSLSLCVSLFLSLSLSVSVSLRLQTYQ